MITKSRLGYKPIGLTADNQQITAVFCLWQQFLMWANESSITSFQSLPRKIILPDSN